MTQKERILQYIEDFGSITPMEAFKDLGITKLATRVSELIFEGYKFEKKLEKGKNRYGDSTCWMRYSFKVD